MSLSYLIPALLIMAAVMFSLRAFPFVLFGRGKKVSPMILYLGHVMAPAAVAMLVVYCLKDIDFSSPNHFLPELIAVAAISGVHFWKRNILLSVFGGTVLYMILVQRVFC